MELPEVSRKAKKFTKMDKLFKKNEKIMEGAAPFVGAKESREKGGAAAEGSMSIEETNKIRASLGLKPLK